MRTLCNRVNKTFPVRKAGEVLKGKKGAHCPHVGGGEAQQLHYSGKAITLGYMSRSTYICHHSRHLMQGERHTILPKCHCPAASTN